MKMRSILPHPSISEYVHDIVVIEDNDLHCDMVLPLIAKGYPSIAFQVTGSGLVTGTNNKIDNLVLYGQNIRPFELYVSGHVTIIAYFLYPPVVKSLFGFSAREATNLCIDLSHLPPANAMNIKEQLINATSLGMRLQLMNSYVWQLAEQRYPAVNNTILFATQVIRKSKGIISLRNVQSELNVTERTFQRLFDFHIGLSPKMFSKICQFHSAFQQVSKNHFSRLSDIAYENGYADQSHFIRAFKEFTNYSPGEYLKNCPDLEA